MLPAIHSLHFRVHTRVLLTLLVALAATAALWAEPPHRTLLREALEAQRAGDLAAAIAKLETVRSLRPDYPRARFGLAGLYAANGRTAEALDELRTAADMGLAANLSRIAALAPLRELPGYAELDRRFSDNATPVGSTEKTLTLSAQDGIIESVAVDSQGRYFFADVRNRCIWIRGTDGQLTRFSQPQDGVLGIFSLALDETRGVLWAGVSAVPEMLGFTAADRGRGCLAEYDLRTGAHRRSLHMPTTGGEHVLGSLRLGPDGVIYATDSASPVIWRATAASTTLEPWLEHADFASLQGLAFSADGTTLYVADYANGIWSVDTATRTARRLETAPGVTLFGIDDLHLVDGALLGMQNGIAPARIVRVPLGQGALLRAEVLLQSDSALADAATGIVRSGRYEFISASGWSIYERPSPTPSPARDVSLFALNL